jgi:hypothetical protein
MGRATVTSSVCIPDSTLCYMNGPDATLEFLTAPDEHVSANAFKIIVGDYLDSHMVSTLFGGEYALQVLYNSPWEASDDNGNPGSPYGYIYSPAIGSSSLRPRFADDTEGLNSLYEWGGTIDVYDMDAFNGWLSHLSADNAATIRNAMRGGDLDNGKSIVVRFVNRETGETTSITPTAKRATWPLGRVRARLTQLARRR